MQRPWTVMSLVVRGATDTGDPRRLSGAVRAAIHEVDHDQAVTNVQTMEEGLASAIAQSRVIAALLGAFAAIAVLMAAAGLYGVIAYTVTQRTREIAVRLALGARPESVFWLIVRQGLWLTAFGIVVGVVGAVLATRAISTLLFGVNDLDPLTYVGVSVLLVVVAVAACYLPARRAARINPMIALLSAVMLMTTATISMTGCDRLYYGTMKKFGVEKRDILVKRVKDARKSQQEAKEEFQSALDKFKSVIEVEGSSLEDKYNTLNKELERSESRAKDVHDRVNAVRDVSQDLFREWEKELKQYSNSSLRAESQRELNDTRRRANTLIAAMTRAEQRIDPVLRPLRDRVLFLKHHLNAQAIGALDKELISVKSNVDSLVADLEKAIAEADAFAQQMDADAKK